jgi:uncharacterized protein (DUF433 family)
MDHPLIEDRGCGPMLKSCRIHVNNLWPYLQRPDYRDEQMLQVWPITSEELQALKAYIADHYEEVKEANRKVDERIRREIEAQQTPENLARWEESRQRMAFRQQWFQEMRADPTLFPEVAGESADDRRARLAREFDRWRAARSEQKVAEAG